MKNINSEELCQAVKGRFLRKVDKKGFQGVCTDSRSIGINGKIFFALHGSQFDGHEFISEVLKKNIGAIIVHRPVAHDLLKKEIKSETQSVIIQVEDTLKSLGYLAAFWREKLI